MGQKVTPIALRSGIKEQWNSSWYNPYSYSNLWFEERKLKIYLNFVFQFLKIRIYAYSFKYYLNNKLTIFLLLNSKDLNKIKKDIENLNNDKSDNENKKTNKKNTLKFKIYLNLILKNFTKLTNKHVNIIYITKEKRSNKKTNKKKKIRITSKHRIQNYYLETFNVNYLVDELHALLEENRYQQIQLILYQFVSKISKIEYDRKYRVTALNRFLFNKILQKKYKFKKYFRPKFKKNENQLKKRQIKNHVFDILKERTIIGMKISCSGRLGGNDRAKTFFIKKGQINLQTLSADLAYFYKPLYSRYGTYGLKMWVAYK